MKKLLLILLLLLLPIISQAHDPFGDIRAIPVFDADKWMAFYYQNPEPEKTFDAIRLFYHRGKLTDPKSQSTMTAFLASVFRTNEYVTTQVKDSCSYLPQDARWTIANALWFADTRASKAQLKKMEKSNEYLKPFLKSSPFNVLKTKELNKSTVEMCWGNFIATGETKYLNKIIQLLDDNTDGDSEVEIYTRQLIKSNCPKHYKLLKFCRDKVDDQTEAVKIKLQAILNELDS